MCYELTNAEIAEAIKVSTGEEINPNDIVTIETFFIPLYIANIGNTTYLCRKMGKGKISVKKVVW